MKSHKPTFLKWLSVSSLCFVVPAAMATDTGMEKTPALPTISAIADASGVKMSGFVNTSYSYCSSADASNECMYRSYDTARNSFNLHVLDLSLSKLPDNGFGALINLKAGPDADPIDQFDLTQAYLHYANGPFMAIAGKFTNLAGAEALESPANFNFSRSYLFNASPNTHTGVRGYYTPNDKVKFIVGLNNGWDSMPDDNGDKTVELSMGLTPFEPLSLSLAYYTGKEAAGTGQGPALRTLADMVLTYTPTEAWTFILDYAGGSQKNADLVGGGIGTAKWNGLAAYVNVQVSEQWRVAWRSESFDDQDGYILSDAAVSQKLLGHTATLAYIPNTQVELRGELRADKSDQLVFQQPDGSLKKTQNSVAIEAIYKF